jgi:hypothetical protein
MQVDVAQHVHEAVLGWNKVEAHFILCLELKGKDELRFKISNTSGVYN